MKDLMSYCVLLLGELGEVVRPFARITEQRSPYTIELHILAYFGVCTTDRK